MGSMFWKKTVPPPATSTQSDVETARRIYSEKYHYFDSIEELLPEEREFLKETARAALVIEGSKYAKS